MLFPTKKDEQASSQNHFLQCGQPHPAVWENASCQNSPCSGQIMQSKSATLVSSPLTLL